jgi:hypothetical protein
LLKRVKHLPKFIWSQGKEVSEQELQEIIATHDLDHNGVFDEVCFCTVQTTSFSTQRLVENFFNMRFIAKPERSKDLL